MTGRARAARSESAATYVYCVAHAKNPPRLARPPTGLPGTGRVRVVAMSNELYLVVGDAPKARFGEQALERGLRDLPWVSACAAAHEAVVEWVGASATVVPMKLFTLFADDRRALENMRGMRRSLTRLVRRVEGRDEWGVRVLYDENRARLAADRRSSGEGAVLSGRAFLQRKKARRDALSGIATHGRLQGSRVFSELRKHADQAMTRPPVRADLRSRVVLDAVFLVARDGRGAFVEAAKRIRRRLEDEGLEVVLTGPWPAYHFVHGAAR